MGAAESSIFALVARNDLNGVQRMLSNRTADVNGFDENGNTPLFCAATHGLADMCILLLRNGAAADFANKRGQTPLYAAASAGHRGVVRILLKAGAEPTRSCRGGTPLDVARARGYHEIVSDLDVCSMVCLIAL